MKIGHREVLSGGVGTGRALNSGQIVCLDVSETNNRENDVKVATGWVDGSVRVFSLEPKEMARFTSSGSSDDASQNGLVHSLLHGNNNFLGNSDEFACKEPLLLNGHGSSPVQIVAFDKNESSVGRLASAGSDGVVILWDVVAETGLFRLLGHRGPVTGISFICPTGTSTSGMDGLVTSGADGLVKVWDLNGQCCVQTLTGHRGGVGCLDCSILRPPGEAASNAIDDIDSKKKWRLVTGCEDGQVRVWSVEDLNAENTSEDKESADNDEVFRYIGSLQPPANFSSSSNEGIASVHFHHNGSYVGVCRANDRVIEIYAARSEVEAQKKRRRRLRRRREKQSVATNASDKGESKKRGLLDDPESDDDQDKVDEKVDQIVELSPDIVKAMDEFEFRGTIRATHKIRGFAFTPVLERGGGIRVVVALATNALEVHSLPKPSKQAQVAVTSEKVSSLDMYGHPTGIRSVSLSSEDSMACTVSKNVVKIWNVSSRSCLRSIAAASNCYCLCAAFLPGNMHVVLGTREGHLLLIDVASGDIVYREENAHDGAIWSLDIRQPSPGQDSMSLVTGSADKTVKFFEVESQDGENSRHPMLVHARTLQMSDDVMCVRFSHSTDPAKRLVFVASLDSTIKVFFDDSLKFFLSLYGHKLPVLAFDSSDDDTILASGGADKSIKIFGLDFGDTHRTLYGHEDSITDLRFVKRTHNFFTCSKDSSVRFWDGDRFQQILLLNGHASEVCSLVVSRTGAFVLSGGMDRQVRVWERTKDIVFLDEERERELEEVFDKVDGSKRDENTSDVLLRAKRDGDEGLDADDETDEKPQSEAAVKQSILSVSAGDRIMEAVELADGESKEIAAFKTLQEVKSGDNRRAPNPMLFGMDPSQYVLWVLRSVKSVDLEQSLLVLPLKHVERLMHYLILLLRAGKGVELCAKISVFLIKAHQAQIVANRTMMTPLRELQTLVRMRTTEIRDTVGFNIAAMRIIARIANEKKNERINYEEKTMKDIWAGLGK
jgi:U3 small nucleolar RNA-associated protein 12